MTRLSLKMPTTKTVYSKELHHDSCYEYRLMFDFAIFRLFFVQKVELCLIFLQPSIADEKPA